MSPAEIAALERKVGRNDELDLVKKTPRLRRVSDNENSSIVSGPKAAPPDGRGCEVIGLSRSSFYYPTTAAVAVRKTLKGFGMRGSMSLGRQPVPQCAGRKLPETLIIDEAYLAGYETFGDVMTRSPRFIEDTYNAKRLHSAPGYKSPTEFETQLAQRAA